MMTKAQTFLQKYRQNEAGNFAVIGALSAMMLLTAVGVAVDVNAMVKQKSTMQDRLDAAVLAAASSGKTKQSDLQRIVRQTLNQGTADAIKIKPVVKLKNDEIYATAKARFDPMLMGMLGRKNMTVEVKSAAPIAQEVPLHIAMVLDTTGSMAGINMSDLKATATTLVDFVEAQKHSQNRISVVPFSDYVNIGMSRRSVPWMSVPADGPNGPAPACYAQQSYTQTGCSTSTVTRYNDGVPYTATVKTGCTTTATPTGNTVCHPAPTIEWRGCAGSRDAPLNIVADANAANPIGGAMNESCGEELLPLSGNYVDVRRKIASLTSNGATYIPSGLVWGWRTLTPTAPFTEAVGAPDDTVRSLILMTDGGNTMTQTRRYSETVETYHRTFAQGDNDSAKEAKKRIIGLCDSIKADGITIFTIAYRLPSGTKGANKVLRNCASNASFAFKARNRNQLTKAFDEIGKSMKTVRLSQ